MTQDEAKKYFTFDEKHPCPDELDRFSMRDAEGRKKFTEAMAVKHKDFRVHQAREKDHYDCCGVSAGTITMIVEVKDRKEDKKGNPITLDTYQEWALELSKYNDLVELGDIPTSPKWPKTIKKFFVSTCTDGMLIWNLDDYSSIRKSPPHKKKYVDSNSEDVQTDWCYYNKNKARIVRFCEPTEK